MAIEHKTYGASFLVKRDEDGVMVFFRGGVEILAEDLRTSETYLVNDFLRLEMQKKSK